MRAPLRKWLLILLALLLLLPPLAYWAADSWLESSGGRRMIEKELSARAGMPVRLEGEFDLMLLPDIGVSGTGLRMGGEGGEPAFVRGSRYEISLALAPLLDRQFRLDWIRLTGGEIHPGRYPSPEEGPAGRDGAGFRLPEIGEFAVRDVRIVLPGAAGEALRIRELTVSGFAENRDTPFDLHIEDLASATGELRWDPDRALLRFSGLRVEVAGESVGGVACLHLRSPVSLQAELEAEALDLDAVIAALPDPDGAGGAGALETDLRIRLSAGELRSSGAVARGVVVRLGEEPRCP